MKKASSIFLTFVCSVVLLWLPEAIWAEGESVLLELDSAELYPGDLLEVRITLRSPEFRRWTLEAPRHDNLRIVGEQAFPIHASEDTGYEATWIVVYQSIQAGEVVLAGGNFSRSLGDVELTLPIDERSFVVQSFGEQRDSDELAMLNPEEVGAVVETRRTEWLIALVITVLVGVFGWRRLGMRKNAQGRLSDKERLNEKLASILMAGNLSREDALLLLGDYGFMLSAECVDQLNLIAYARSGDGSSIMEILRRELSL